MTPRPRPTYARPILLALLLAATPCEAQVLTRPLQILYVPAQEVTWEQKGNSFEARLAAFCTNQGHDWPIRARVRNDWAFWEPGHAVSPLAAPGMVVYHDGTSRLVLLTTLKSLTEELRRIGAPTLAIPNPRGRSDALPAMNFLAANLAAFRRLDAQRQALAGDRLALARFDDSRVQHDFFWAHGPLSSWRAMPDIPRPDTRPISRREVAVNSPPPRPPSPPTPADASRWVLRDAVLRKRLERFPTRLAIMRQRPSDALRMLGFLLANGLLRGDDPGGPGASEFSQFRSLGTPLSRATLLPGIAPFATPDWLAGRVGDPAFGLFVDSVSGMTPSPERLVVRAFLPGDRTDDRGIPRLTHLDAIRSLRGRSTDPARKALLRSLEAELSSRATAGLYRDVARVGDPSAGERRLLAEAIRKVAGEARVAAARSRVPAATIIASETSFAELMTARGVLAVLADETGMRGLEQQIEQELGRLEREALRDHESKIAAAGERRRAREVERELYLDPSGNEMALPIDRPALLLAVRRSVVPYLCIWSNVVLPDGDLFAHRVASPSGSVRRIIEEAAGTLPAAERDQVLGADMWVDPSVRTVAGLDWSDRDDYRLLLGRDWTWRPLPRVLGRAAGPGEADWLRGVDDLARELDLAAVQHGGTVVRFDAASRVLSLPAGPATDPAAILARLRALIGLGRDFAFAGLDAVPAGPCVLRVDRVDPGGSLLEGLRGQVQALGMRNPLVFTTQDDLVAVLDRIATWRSWTAIEGKVDEATIVKHVRNGKGEITGRDTEGEAIAAALDGLVIGEPGGRTITIRIFHNESEFLDRLMAEARAGTFRDNFLVIIGCHRDHTRLLELQHEVIAHEGRGVVAPFAKEVDPMALALGPLYLRRHPELLLDAAPGEAIRRGYEHSVRVLNDCVNTSDEAVQFAEDRLRRAFGEEALPFFRTNGQYQLEKVRAIRNAIRTEGAGYLDFGATWPPPPSGAGREGPVMLRS